MSAAHGCFYILYYIVAVSHIEVEEIAHCRFADIDCIVVAERIFYADIFFAYFAGVYIAEQRFVTVEDEDAVFLHSLYYFEFGITDGFA